jgi:iron complex outermembrane receptor protein
MVRFKLALSLGLGAAALATSSAYAQSAPPQSPPEEAESAAPNKPSTETADPSDIVVTAQRRSERLRDVPLAVSAYTGNALRDQQITTLTDLRQVNPSLNFTPSANARGEGFAIRGVGTAIFSDTVEQSVGVVLDGVVLGRSGQATSDLLDIDRVEVLRGPQGLLFGKNASAGVIAITTRRPQFDATTLDLFTSYGTLNEVRASAIGNAPLGSKAALRLAVGHQSADGTIRNVLRDEDLNNRDEQNARAKLRYAPSDTVDLELRADYLQRNSRCCAWTALSAPANTPFGARNAIAGIVLSRGNDENAAGARFFQDVRAWGTSGEANVGLGFATLTSISAFRRWKNEDNNDPDLLPINILDINKGISRLSQLSQEVRLASPGGGSFEWVAGLFYYKQRNQTIGEQTGTLGIVALATLLGTTLETVTRNTSKAVFGQVTFRPTRILKLIGGLRYTDENVELDLLQGKSPSANATIPGRFTGAIDGETSADNLSYRVTGQVDVIPQMMVYATHARGFKGPGINTLGVTTSITEVVRPEIPTTWEIGTRGSFLANRLSFAVAAFKTDYKDFQAQVFDQSITPSRFRVTNAGELETKGVEVELSARPITGLSLRANGAYLDARYGEFENIACFTGQPILPFGTVRTSDRQCIRSGAGPAAPAVTNGTGNRLSNVPKYNYSLFGRYETRVSALKAFAQANWNWRSEVSFSAAGDPNLVEDSYGLLGGSIGIGASDDRWTATLWARNLLDKYYATNIISQPVLNAPGVYSQFFAPDSRRLIGASLAVRLGR